MNADRAIFIAGGLAYYVVLLTLIVAVIYNVVMIRKEKREEK